MLKLFYVLNHNLQLCYDEKVSGILTVKNDVRGFCQPGVPISLLNEFPPGISSQWTVTITKNNHNK